MSQLERMDGSNHTLAQPLATAAVTRAGHGPARITGTGSGRTERGSGRRIAELAKPSGTARKVRKCL